MPDQEDSEQSQGLKACASDIISAIEAKDPKRLAQAFKDMFEICEAYPHDEYQDEQDTE